MQKVIFSVVSKEAWNPPCSQPSAFKPLPPLPPAFCHWKPPLDPPFASLRNLLWNLLSNILECSNSNVRIALFISPFATIFSRALPGGLFLAMFMECWPPSGGGGPSNVYKDSYYRLESK